MAEVNFTEAELEALRGPKGEPGVHGASGTQISHKDGICSAEIDGKRFHWPCTESAKPPVEPEPPKKGFAANTPAYLPIVPGAAGFGFNWGPLPAFHYYFVTNRDPGTGPGTYRGGVMGDWQGVRIVVFLVGGVISCPEGTTTVVKNDHLIVAGQTAPGGLVLHRAGMQLRGDKQLLSHLLLTNGRFSDRGLITSRGDVLQVNGGSNVAIVNCGVLFGSDENISIIGGARNVSFYQSLTACALMNAGHPKGFHSMGFMADESTTRVDILRSVLANNNQRNPLLRARLSTFANNVISNWGRANAGHADMATVTMNMEANIYKPGPNSLDSAFRVYGTTKPDSRIYWDNVKPLKNSAGNVLANERQEDAYPQGYTLHTGDDLEELVLAANGPKHPALKKIYDDIRNGTGKLIDEPFDVSIPESSHELDLPDPNAPGKHYNAAMDYLWA